MNAALMSRTCTTGRHGVPSLLISILPVVKAHATRLLNTISHRNLGLAPNAVEGRMQTTVKSDEPSAFNASSASHLVRAYAVIGFFSLSSSSSSSLLLDTPYMLCEEP